MERMLYFMSTLFLGVFMLSGCAKEKPPSNDNEGPNTELKNDLKGKKDILGDLQDIIEIHIEGFSGPTQLWNKTIYGHTPEYLEGITPTNEDKIHYLEAGITQSRKGGDYEGKKFCMVSYDKDLETKIKPPLCDLGLDTSYDQGMYFLDFSKEMIIYAFIGTSVETSTEYFILPPMHKKG